MIQIDQNEMYQGYSNIFSIRNYIIVSDSTLVTVGKLFAKAAGKPENYFKKSNNSEVMVGLAEVCVG